MNDPAPFRLPNRLYVGAGTLARLDIELKTLGVANAALIADMGVSNAGLARAVRDAAPAVNFVEWNRIEHEPSLMDLLECIRFVRSGKFDAIVGVGGGSALDVAKAAAALAHIDLDAKGRKSVASLSEDLGDGGQLLPLVLVPTTSGTGSEVTPNAIFLDPETQEKVALVSPSLIPLVAIVDPEMAATAPRHVTASAGMDALAHAVESYISVRATLHTSIYALEAAKLVFENLECAVSNGADRAAREGMAFASLFAGISIAHAGTAAGHALAYPLGSRYRIPHGVANGVLLPYVMELNMQSSPARLAEIARAAGKDIDGMGQAEAAGTAVRAMAELAESVGLPKNLTELGIGEDDVPFLVKDALAVTRLMKNNPHPVSSEDAERVFRAALAGDIGMVCNKHAWGGSRE